MILDGDGEKSEKRHGNGGKKCFFFSLKGESEDVMVYDVNCRDFMVLGKELHHVYWRGKWYRVPFDPKYDGDRFPLVDTSGETIILTAKNFLNPGEKSLVLGPDGCMFLAGENKWVKIIKPMFCNCGELADVTEESYRVIDRHQNTQIVNVHR